MNELLLSVDTYYRENPAVILTATLVMCLAFLPLFAVLIKRDIWPTKKHPKSIKVYFTKEVEVRFDFKKGGDA